MDSPIASSPVLYADFADFVEDLEEAAVITCAIAGVDRVRLNLRFCVHELGRLIIVRARDWELTAHERGGVSIAGPRPLPFWVCEVADSLSRHFAQYWAESSDPMPSPFAPIIQG